LWYGEPDAISNATEYPQIFQPLTSRRDFRPQALQLPAGRPFYVERAPYRFARVENEAKVRTDCSDPKKSTNSSTFFMTCAIGQLLRRATLFSPNIIAAEIDDLQAALGQLAEIASDLKK
jgi:hypothetical protein